MNRTTLEGGEQLRSHGRRPSNAQSRFSRLVASVLAAILSLAGLVAIGPAAYANIPGITTEIWDADNNVLTDSDVPTQHEQGDMLKLRVQYDTNVTPGEIITIQVPEAVTLLPGSIDVAADNTAIESINVNDKHEIEFVFKHLEDWGANHVSGVFSLDFTIDTVEQTGTQELSWVVNGQPTTIQVVVRVPGDEHADVTNDLSKSASGNIGGPYVSVDRSDRENPRVVLADDITNHQIHYTLTINSDADTPRENFRIADELSDYLLYNEDSFEAELTTWDENGWNKKTEDYEFSPSFGGNSFEGTVNVDGPSELTITYSASINPERLDDLQGALQKAYIDMNGFPYGSFSLPLKNTASFGGTQDSATVTIGTNVPRPPGPGLGQAFAKTSPTQQQRIAADEEGNLDPRVDFSFIISANLSQWDNRDDVENPEEFVLNRNVVISDTLPNPAKWDTEQLTITGSADGQNFTEATNFTGNAEAFAADQYVGQYAFVGQNLYVNVGSNKDNNVRLELTAFIDTTNGLNGRVGDYGFTYYRLDNTATFTYLEEGRPYTRTANVNFYDRGDTSNGVNIPGAFKKDAPNNGNTKYIRPGQSATLDYTFVVNDGAPWDEDNIDVTKSYIVDYRDPSVFDFSDLEGLQAKITGSYGNTGLTGNDFQLTLTDDGNLRLELSEDRKSEFAANPMGRLQINLPLETVVFDGRQTIDIENRATLYGEDDQPRYWSETTSDASSYGSEAEVRKAIRDTPNERWTQNLRVELDEDGNVVGENNTLVYNLAYIPHQEFYNLIITPVVDELPEEVKFLGFVEDDAVDTGNNPRPGPVDMGGNLEAVYDAETHSITVRSKDGQRIPKDSYASANVLVELDDEKLHKDVPVVNVFGRSSATYTPSEGYPLSIQKINTFDDEVVIHDEDARFNIYNEDDELVIEDAFVHNGFLSVWDETGKVSGTVVEETGTYYVEEIKAPYGYFESEERVEVVVGEDGSSSRVVFRNDPWPTYAIGDYVWIDSNRNGLQDNDEDPLEGVTVVLYDGNENELGRTKTNEDGRYIFDRLYAGEYQVRFILTDEQADIYEFTGYRTGDSVSNDSNAGSSGFSQKFELGPDNRNLEPNDDYDHADVRASEGIDPTWDAGVVPVDFAIGDYVWIDENRDGIQDRSEPVLEDVTVILYNGQGEELDRTTTDDNGRYLFDNLPRGEYQVGFELNGEQQELYEFTSYNSSNDPRWDSDAGDNNRSAVFILNEDNSNLRKDYRTQDVTASQGIDPTWDAGVVRVEYAIGDYVWIDSNGNGSQDEGEKPLEGVTVVLYDGDDNELDRTKTDNNGRYMFDNLTYGYYQVEFILTDEQAEQYNFTVYADGDAELDSDAGRNGRSEIFYLDRDNRSLISNEEYAYGTVTASEGIDPTWDAGVVEKTYAIGDYVWIDENRDGIQDEDEEPLEGVTVVLYNGDGDKLESTTTDENGRYIFDNLPRGEYQVGFELDDAQRELFEVTDYTVGNEDDNVEVDSNAGENGRSAVFELGPNSELTSDDDYEYFEVNASEGIDPSWDAGVVRIEYAVGDYVWFDANKDGVQDEDEAPLADVTVNLYRVDADGNVSDEPFKTTVTDENGRYLFDNLTYGDYQVEFVLTDEQARLYNFTEPTIGEDTEVDSNAGERGRSRTFRLDRDNASLISNDEYDYGTVTASEGIDPTWDAGVVTKTYAIGDYVWVDDNADGQQDDGEEPLEGVTVELYTVDEEGNRSEDPVATATTDEHGRYLFDDLETGDYQVRYILTEQQQRKYNFTEYADGDSETDSDAGDEGFSEIFTLDVDNTNLDPEYSDQEFNASEGVDPTWDAGVTPKPYAIGDYVWIDENRNGIQDDDEPSLEGVTVVLYAGEGKELERTTTDEKGRYLFDYLNAGEYQVGFELTEAQRELFEFTDYTVGADDKNGGVDSNAGEDGRSEVFTLNADSPLVTLHEYEHGEFGARLGIDPTWDAGVVRIEYAIGDYVWIDTNNNGLQDKDEEPLEGVTVVLYNGEGEELDRTTTDEHGRYLFDNLPRGDYRVGFILTEEQAAIYEFTDYNVGGNVEVDSNAGEHARSEVFTLGPDNEFLVLNHDYEYGTVTASRGIDPTWDAGVVLRPEPVAPEDPEDPADAATSGDEDSGAQDGKLPLTGANLALLLTAIGLVLLASGGAISARNRKANQA